MFHVDTTNVPFPPSTFRSKRSRICGKFRLNGGGWLLVSNHTKRRATRWFIVCNIMFHWIEMWKMSFIDSGEWMMRSWRAECGWLRRATLLLGSIIVMVINMVRGTRRNLVEMKLDSGMIVYKLQFNIELISRCGCCGISQRREYATGSC